MNKIFTLFLLLILTGLGFSQADKSHLSKYIDSLMTKSYPQNLPGAVILAAKNDSVIFQKAYGLANVQLKVPNKIENVFCIGSISKQFAAISILQLVEKGKLKLSDNIDRFFPEYNLKDKNITIENILTHTSGIVSYTEKQNALNDVVKSVSKKDLVEIFINDSLIFKPSSDWSYSNSGFVLAAIIVEKISGLTYQDYVKENIFKPLGMNSTFFGTNTDVIPNYVEGYGVADTLVALAGYLNWTWILGAGDILSSTEDMFKWYKGLKTYKILSKEYLDKAWTSFILTDGNEANYGLGFAVDEYNGMKLVSHGGSIGGFLADEVIVPEKDIYVVVLSNKQGRINPKEVTTAAALMIAGNPLENLNYIPLKTSELLQYQGVYEVHRAGSRLAKNLSSEKMYNYVTVKDDTLYIQRTGGGKEPIFSIGKDVFARKNSYTYLKFNKVNNKVTSLEIFSIPINYGSNEIEPLTEIPLPVEKKAIKVSGDKLKVLSGKYELEGDFIITIRVENDKIFLDAPGEPAEEIFPETEKKFFLKSVDATVEFLFSDGKVTGLVLDQVRKYPGKKIE